VSTGSQEEGKVYKKFFFGTPQGGGGLEAGANATNEVGERTTERKDSDTKRGYRYNLIGTTRPGDEKKKKGWEDVGLTKE